MQLRNREKRDDKEHHEKVSFFDLAEFYLEWFFLFYL